MDASDVEDDGTASPAVGRAESKPERPSNGLLLVKLGWIALAAISCAAYWLTISSVLGSGMRLDLGSVGFPTGGLASVWNVFAIWGGLLAIALYFVVPDGLAKWVVAAAERNPRALVAMMALLAGLISVLIKIYVLRHAYLTDDESIYRFSAAMLRGSELALDAPPFREFFERQFMVVGERVYGQYFLGWPALIALFSLLGLGEWASLMFTCLTIIPFARILRRYCEPSFFAAGLAIYAASLMVQVMGATLLAHAATAFMMLSFVDLALQLEERGSSTLGKGALCAALFCAAFFVRPATALALGAPFLLKLAIFAVRSGSKARRALAGFVIVSALCGASFLLLNQVLYGGALETGYSRYMQHLGEIGKSAYGPSELTLEQRVSLVLGHPELQAKILWASLERLSYDMLGWPVYLVAICLLGACISQRLWPMVAAVFLSVCLHGLIMDMGIDSFGPVHLHEAGLFLIILCAAGAQRISGIAIAARQTLQRHRPLAFRSFKAAAALIVSAWLLYFPLRLFSLSEISSNVLAPLHAADRIPGKAIVFVKSGRTSDQTKLWPTRHFSFYMPVNSPDFSDRILWVQDLGVNRNADLLKLMPDRSGYRLGWRDHEPVLIPLGESA